MLTPVLLLSGAAAAAAGNPAFTTLGDADPGGKADGPMFWRPGISIPTGIKGHVAQHVTTSGLGAAGCHGHSCEQILLTKDSGATYEVVANISSGYATHNFNGAGDLGTWLPPLKNTAPVGTFQTVVGSDSRPCRGALCPAFVLTWAPAFGG